MKPNTFNIYVMSYKRPNAILTQNLLEYCTYVVREEEAEAYRQNGVKNILPIPKGAVHDFMSTLYWIINNTPEDVIYVADDDITSYVYLLDDLYEIKLDDGEPDKETATAEIERVAQLIYDLGIGVASEQISLAPYSYDREFNFKGVPGHTRWINKTALKATYNPEDSATSDIDMWYQEMLKNRITLQPKYFRVKAFMDKNEGNGANREHHYAMIEAMKSKWGKYYGYNFKRNIPEINIKR